MKLSDYVVAFLADRGVRNIYLVSGGGMMHLLDSLGRERRIRYVCNHHEQASAIAAESEARVTGRPGVCMVTTGPGATNALSGIVGAWYDSVPVVVISGQVRTDVMANFEAARQLGPQEVNIAAMARPCTKYFATVREPRFIRQELERAFYHAQEGRPGPTWLDIPLDVQSAMIDETTLPGSGLSSLTPQPLAPSQADIASVVEALRGARRPVLIAGNGIHLAGARDQLRAFVEHTGLPTLLTIGGADLLEEDHPLFFGRLGPLGQRRANFVLQNSDLVLAVGASLCLASIGFNTDAFAPRARKLLVNVDRAELAKKIFVQERGVLADAGEFLRAYNAAAPLDVARRADWLGACLDWKLRYPPLATPGCADGTLASPYVFAATLGEQLPAGAVVVTGNSMDWWVLYQAMPAKRDQRLYTNLNYGAMGWDLGAAIGACCARPDAQTILVTGDGGMQTNVQELTVIGHHRMELKIFVLSNDGYQSIRATQDNFFEGRHVGVSSASGVGIPDLEKLAAANRIAYARIASDAELAPGVAEVLAMRGPVLCELVISPTQERLPRVKSYRREDGTIASPALEDMYPPLPAEELAYNTRFMRGDD